MGINGVNKGNLGVHGVANVLLWYCQIIKIRGSNEPLFLCKEVMENHKVKRKAETICR